MNMSEERYRFLVEWFDPTIKIKKEFLLSFYPLDNSIEMYDIISKRIFLRRISCDDVDISNFFIGNMINVLSRQLYIVNFADAITSAKFAQKQEATLVVINFSGFKYLGEIINIFELNGLSLSRGKMLAKENSNFIGSNLNMDLSQKFVVFEMRGEHSFYIYKKLLGQEENFPYELKATLGELSSHCICPSDQNMKYELEIFFPTKNEIHCNTLTYENSTCCIIKPHALREKITGKILQDIINANYEISGLEIITFDIATASEFLEVYKGVIADYKEMVEQLISGPCLALEISCNGQSKIHQEFRNLIGPMDPEIARKLRPKTLRALYGQNKIKNALHCTDLPEDAILELDYVFRVLFS